MNRPFAPCKPHPELDALLEKVKSLPPMTKEQREAQCRSWVIGEMMIDDPDMTRQQAEALYDEVCR